MDERATLAVLYGMRKRLKRRNILLDEVRKAYLRDVVLARSGLTRDTERLTRDTERQQTSVNLRPTLSLYAPSECTFQVVDGAGDDSFGGHLEIIHHESKRVADLSKEIEKLLALEQQSRFKATSLEVQVHQDQTMLKSQQTKHLNERVQLCSIISTLKDRLSCLDETALENAQRAIKSLKHQLEQSEMQIRDLSPLANNAIRSGQEASRYELLLSGRDNRITEMETKLARVSQDLSLQLDKQADLTKKIAAGRSDNDALQRKYSETCCELNDSKIQCDSAQISLDESRRLEAELTQKLTDLQIEYTEGIQREEAEHEELRLQLESTREESQLFKKQVDDVQEKFLRYELSQKEALLKVRTDVEQQLSTKHRLDVQQLQEELTRSDEKFCRCDAKLKLEQEKRAVIDAELRGLRVEEQSQTQISTALSKEYRAKIAQISSLMGASIDENSAHEGDFHWDLETVKTSVRELMATVERLKEDKQNLVSHLDQYKAKSDASSSSAKLSLTVAEEVNNSAKELYQVHDSDLHQLKVELKAAIVDQDRLKGATKAMSESLDSTRAQLSRLASEENIARQVRAVAQEDLSKKTDAEIDVGRALSQRWNDVTTDMMPLRGRLNELEKLAAQFEQISVDAIRAPKQSQPRQRQQQPSSSPTSGPIDSISSSIEDPAFREELIAAVSRVTHALSQEGTFSPAEVEFGENRAIASRLVSLAANLASAMESNLVELTTLRELALSLPKDFSYNETIAKITMLEQKVREAGEGESGKKVGREEELQRLKQRNASQQNFIIELQEEVATMKGLLFSADEVKRQYGELEEKYRLLENEFTEKAENEVNSRKAKERTELQLTLAQADIASLTREKNNLTAAVKKSEDGISKLELNLMQTQRAYEDMQQQERERLETNKHFGSQYSPLLADVHAQTSFKTPGMTLRQINSFDEVPHRKKGCGSVTPADCPV